MEDYWKKISMRSYVLIWILLTSCLFTLDVNAQAVAQERPDEWNKLVYGGRFMDRFLPMPVQGELTSETWGADNVKPRYIDNGIEDNEWSYWGETQYWVLTESSISTSVAGVKIPEGGTPSGGILSWFMLLPTYPPVRIK